jgi:2-polyprenyl-6-methoxyphenol hydroxylase-like FAD-dependent oxidoreductase
LLIALSKEHQSVVKGKSKESQVLIVGAGPVGLSLALALLRQGIEDIRIVDKSTGPTDQSRALGIQARTLEIFEQMGIVEPVLKAGQKISVMNFYADKRLILHITFDELESAYPYALSLPQSQTERILINELKGRGVEVERQTELVDLAQDASRVKPTLKYPDGTGIAENTQWLIACDGAHSAVRHRLNMAFEGTQYPEAFLLADVRLDAALSQQEAHLFTDENGMLAIFPYGNDRYRVVADTPVSGAVTDSASVASVFGSTHDTKADVVRLKDPTLAEFQTILDERGPGGIKMSDPSWLAAFSIHRRRVKYYRKDRIFLAGDAAHIHSPAGGQGMNTGIQDAYNLAWKLALVIQKAAPEDLLDSYNIERHAVAQSVLKMTDFITRVNTMRNPVARSIRTRLAPLLVAQEVIQQRLRKSVSELAVNYRRSPIVAEHRVSLIHARVSGHAREELPEFGEWFSFDQGPAPGDRAPDANLLDKVSGAPIRLFDLLRTKEHHLLLLAGARSTPAGVKSLMDIAKFVGDKYGRWVKVHFIAPNEIDGADFPAGASCLQDPELSLHHRYGAGSECLYLIRPDGYIGFRSLPADRPDLSRYLEKIFLAR